MPITMPNPIRLFHITAIDNLANICKNNAIISKNRLASQSINYNNIAHESCQDARSRKFVPDPPSGCMHDYVPFYFAPRSPMLFAIQCGQVVNCNYSQYDIVHFELLLTRDILANIANSLVFYDRNATVSYANAYTNIGELNNAINWKLICDPPILDGYCKFFQDSERYPDRKQQRQAEFLIKNQVSSSCFNRIGVINEVAQQNTHRVLQQYDINLPVEIKTEWYFLGQ